MLGLTGIRLYGALAALVAFLAQAGAMLWYRGEAIHATAQRDQARAELAQVVAANKSLEEANKRLANQIAINNGVIAGFVEELAGIREATAANTDAVHELEKSNEDVRAYLSTLVPDALRLQLDR